MCTGRGPLQAHHPDLRDVLQHTLYLAPDAVRVDVLDGVVTLRGEVRRKTTLPVVLRLCRTVDGVVAVHNQLRYTFDDTGEVEPAPRCTAFCNRKRVPVGPVRATSARTMLAAPGRIDSPVPGDAPLRGRP